MKNFFISYNKADRDWAEWIAWSLEEAGYSVVIQAWDFRPGENFVLKMQEAAVGTEKTIAVLSEDYLKAEFTQPEWAEAFKRDPQGKQRILIPVRVKDCAPPGLLSPTIYIDLVSRSEPQARKELLDGVGKDRAKPTTPPKFPGDVPSPSRERVMPNPVPYPGFSVTNQDSAKANIPSNLPIGIPFFTGRDDILRQLEQALKTTGATALAQRQALSGLGGIGKTQTAIEYARRHRHEYKSVLWAVAESKESLISDYVAIAGILGLPEANVQDQTFIVKAVRNWLENNSDWLLILDNADHPGLVEEFLPANPNGHLLLTSRAQVFDSLGILNPIEVEEMTPVDATEFLLKRTGRSDLQKVEALAVEQLTEELDYLPLALEQAGAYIKELRGSFQDYLASYRQRGLELLEKGHSSGYRKSVRTTWSLNFEQVEQTSAPAADLLRASAFLNPDRIPAELISIGKAELGPELSEALANVEVDPLSLDEVLQPLIQYSLIHRDREFKSFDIHRLVQAVLKEGMSDSSKRVWAERLVKAMATVFPDVDAIEFSQWYRIERLLAHAQTCTDQVIALNLEIEQGADLLNLVGRYLHLRGRLDETEPLYNMAVSLREKLFGREHPDLATSLHNLAWLRLDRGSYEQARSLVTEALGIREKRLGAEHPQVAKSLDLLGRIYKEQGEYREANHIFQRSLQLREVGLEANHPDIGISLILLADIYLTEDKNSDAEPLLLRAKEILENTLTADYYELPTVLSNLGVVYMDRGKASEAERFFLRSLAIREKAFGSSHPRLAGALSNLARLYMDQEKYEEAEQLIARSLKIREIGLGLDHPEVALSLDRFTELYRAQHNYSAAEKAAVRSLTIRENSLGSNHPQFANSLINLARLYSDWKKYSKGEPLARRAFQMLRDTFGVENSNTARAMFVLADLLNGMNRKGEAQKLVAQARKIQHKLTKKR